jgi:hypothetical protein
MKRAALIVFLVAFAVLSALAYSRLRRENAALDHEIAALRARTEETTRLAAENERLRHLLELANQHRGDAQAALHAEVMQARHDVDALERQAREQFLEKTASDAAQLDALNANRDLRKGLVLVENCTNAGQATPEDALQTIVWASVNGHEDTLARMIAVSGAARTVAEAMLATLPESTRAKYPTPESLVVLYAEDTLKDIPAVQITDEKRLDAQHVTLLLRTANPRPSEIPMQLGPSGWQIDLSQGKLFEKVKSQLLKARK